MVTGLDAEIVAKLKTADETKRVGVSVDVEAAKVLVEMRRAETRAQVRAKFGLGDRCHKQCSQRQAWQRVFVVCHSYLLPALHTPTAFLRAYLTPVKLKLR